MVAEFPPEYKAPVMNGDVFSRVWYRWFESLPDEINSGGTTTAGSDGFYRCGGIESSDGFIRMGEIG